MAEKVELFDTTLRDGQLSPDVHFDSEDRIEIASALERAGIDVIEVAFPGMHPEDIPSTRLIAEQIGDASLCCLARLNPADIESAADALAPCSNPRVHVYLDAKSIRSLNPNSPAEDPTLDRVEKMVRFARNLVSEVEFSPQDATRIELEPLAAVIQAALAGGARIINLSDTTGTSNVNEIKKLFHQLLDLISDTGDVVISLHAHDHLGNAVDNALSSIHAGARQIEGTINGVGPAGGNTDLVQVVERLKTEAEALGVFVHADCSRLHALSRQVTKRKQVHL